VIDATDYQILELSAAGSYLGETVSVAFRLRNRQTWSSAEGPPSQFELPAVPNAITLDGVSTDDFGRDLLTSALRELARSRR
jgi:hexokinase